MSCPEQLYETLTSFSNLYNSFLKAKRGCRKNKELFEFCFDLERNLISLRKELLDKTYVPGRYRYFKIYDPKERLIAVAPFRDRVVHHAVISVIEPIYERIFIYDSYATRKGKGTHRAIKRAQLFLRNNRWFLKADIKKYFDSIDHEVLLDVLSKRIKDKDVMWLLERIIRNGGRARKGLPIGNLTSQFLANVYLDVFDQFVKNTLKVKCYLRYMDDMVFFSNDKNFLLEIRKKTEEFLNRSLKLEFKNAYINQQMNGLTFVGARIFPFLIRIKPKTLHRCIRKIKRRIKEYETGVIEESRLKSQQQLARQQEQQCGFPPSFEFCNRVRWQIPGV